MGRNRLFQKTIESTHTMLVISDKAFFLLSVEHTDGQAEQVLWMSPLSPHCARGGEDLKQYN